jgi:hypothetical protein
LRNEAAANAIRALKEAGAHAEAPACDTIDAIVPSPCWTDPSYPEMILPIGGLIQASIVLSVYLDYLLVSTKVTDQRERSSKERDLERDLPATSAKYDVKAPSRRPQSSTTAVQQQTV